uniref:Uncharacterized protein n=1 Tax=Anguilla anguilla TaxID=7936 RepID=A0A0E9RSZ0_ANGAN
MSCIFKIGKLTIERVFKRFLAPGSD